jgi:pimeloyl-ACP methyl ester carboxylesterase
VPTLLVYSRADRLVGYGDGARLAARMPAARLLSLDGATHYSVPFAPEAVDAVLRWMDAHGRDAEAA